MSEESQYESAWEAVLATLRRAQGALTGLSAGERLLVACSGGTDSVVLLHAVLAVRGAENLALAHVDHGLRPDSREDRDFVAALAQRLGLPLLERSLELGAPAPGRTGETLARELRYRTFAEMAREWQASALATGHHADDQVETVLFRLLRGTGVAGLEGMPAARRLWLPQGPWVIRPLLQASRALIRAAAIERDLEAVEDPTNQDRNMTRNRIRHELTPLLRERFGPGFGPALLLLAADAARLQGALRAEGAELAARAPRRAHGPLEETWFSLPTRPLETEILVEALRQELGRRHPERWIGPPPRFLERCRALVERPRQGARALALGLGQVVLRHDQVVVLPHPLPGPLRETCLAVPGSAEVLDGLWIEARPEIPPPMAGLKARAPDQIWLDLARVQTPLSVRARRSGDRFHPLGAPGEVALKDFLVARKVPWWIKDLMPLLLDQSGRILWVGGLEVGHPWRVRPTTKSGLRLEIRTCS